MSRTGRLQSAVPSLSAKNTDKLCDTRNLGQSRIGFRLAALAGLVVALLGASGCRHRNQAQLPPPQALPPPPEQPVYAPPPAVSETQVPPPGRIPITPVPPGGVTADDLDYIATHRPILTQEGYATWYTAPYQGRKAANGQVFSDYAMTAAHRTLPLGALIQVTNLTTGQSAAMRINDRGPFVEDRVLDMTIASAKATGIYRAGLALVRIDVYETPKSINSGGRWCVQIGALHSEREAIKLKEELLRTYADSNVIEFPGENSYWVRIRPEGDDRQMAEYIARHLQLNEGTAYLTRLD
ncbi:MAG: septal ring lytic transglycosylase RlpA family protein [Terracidiphilus sp.]